MLRNNTVPPVKPRGRVARQAVLERGVPSRWSVIKLKRREKYR